MIVIPFACGDGPGDGDQAGERATPVAVVTVELRVLDMDRHWSGRLEPLRTHAVQAPGSGRVAYVGQRDGDLVRAGDVLIRMESPDLEARRDVINERRAQLEEELERWRTLAEAGAAGAGEVAAAELRLLDARDQASQLESSAETYQLRAPSSGRVNATMVAPGANVTAGQTLLSVEDDSSLGVRLTVPAAETAYLEELDRLTVVDDRGTPLSLERVVFSSAPHPALVRAELYVAGASGRRGATVLYHASAEALSVPWTAVASDGDRHWVALIAGEDPARVERRTVELGRAHSDGIAVLDGLSQGDRVIRYEPRSHADGRAVQPVEAASERNP